MKSSLMAGLSALALCSPAVQAQAPNPAPPPPCQAAEHRQFDFWIGDWDVFNPAGKLVGHNQIAREYAGCVIHERYSTPRAYAGESLNAWDAQRKVWHQTWMDNTGTVLLLDGAWKDGQMVLEGQGRDPQGRAQRQRISWTPNTDGTVRQHWQTQVAGEDWVTAFDGLYRRRTP
ncbi:hypothetical protein HNQ51_003565 [Inhella inkyongensis]|uniref:Uncharacterized protein n=1 Tax=Inhella inkyongensis TaxID=392593 RepID=A0A840SD00_9BURK|nr:hypothetical protein [Inhella inkyongensis]MBB5206220.1 hypothetical protein [Inhella inkyongensis]